MVESTVNLNPVMDAKILDEKRAHSTSITSCGA